MPERSKKILDQIGVPPFRPMFFLKNPHLQTIGASVLPHPAPPYHQSHVLELSDGDSLVVIEDRPDRWNPRDRIIILTHGLTGCYLSKYMIRMAKKFASFGYMVVRVNQRGCGPGFGHAEGVAHSGRSEDFRDVLKWLKRRFPEAPVTQIGFSLGGNITLKLVGEDGASPAGNLDSAVAVSPPIDLAASSKLLSERQGMFFNKYFSRRIIDTVSRLDAKLGKEKPSIDKGKLLAEIDNSYTAPESGFVDANDYYEKCSSLRVIDGIKIPTLILAALDDPVVDTSVYRRLESTPWLDYILTETGGHIGFVANSLDPREVWWMDQVLVNWVVRKIDNK